jgi:3-methyl-2-oxobutanoate hydroxymethyltransferase
MEHRKPLTTVKLKKMKQDGVPISMLTAYDFPSALLAQEAGIDVILVGDSLGNVVLGYETTVPVTLDDIIYHTRAVTRAATSCFVVADMPFMTYHGSIDTTLANVGRLMREGLPQSVKMEGGKEIAAAVAACVQAGVPVMGHLGLTPQSVNQIGGYLVQGKNSAQAQKLIEDAKALEQAGAFAIVLELVTESLAAYITEQISIPTIGIGASASCDGQVLVFHDLLQYGAESQPKKMVKTYANIGNEIRKGISAYVQDVKARQFPQIEHVFQNEDWRE